MCTYILNLFIEQFMMATNQNTAFLVTIVTNKSVYVDVIKNTVEND